MLQPHQAEHAPTAETEGFNAGQTIISHVANSDPHHPLIHLPPIFGIDLSVTKHVFMLWLVAMLLFVIVSWTVRRALAKGKDPAAPQGLMNGLEIVVEFIRDTIVGPSVGSKWVRVWTPMLLTL